MSTPIIPKSECRKNFNISVGFGEVPGYEIAPDIIQWGFPGGETTFSEEEAILMATKLDQEIRRHPSHLKRMKQAAL